MRVLAALAAEFPGARLTLIGGDSGDGAPALVNEAVRALGLTDRIEMAGGVPKYEVPMRLQGGDVFLNTTNVDNTPVSVIEAQACGLCVVSTNVGGVPYLVEHGRTGLLVPPRDEVAMLAAVRSVLRMPVLASSLSLNGRHAAEALGWSTILPSWEALLAALAARQRARVGARPPAVFDIAATLGTRRTA